MEGGEWGQRQCDKRLSLAEATWHQILIQVRGENGQCFLNGESRGQFTMPHLLNGRVGFLVERNATYRFRNIVIKDPDGKVLLEGLPDLGNVTPGTTNKTGGIELQGDANPAPSEKPELADDMETSEDNEDDSDSEAESPEADDEVGEKQPAQKSSSRRSSRGRGKPIDLLKQLNLQQPGTVGEWRMEKGRLVFPQVESASLAIFDRPPGEYVLKAVVQCQSHAGGLGFGVVAGDSQALVTIDGQGKTGSALGMIEGREGKNNATWIPGSSLVDGTQNVIEITIRKNRIQASCKGRALIDWNDDTSKLSLPGVYAGRHGARQLFITMGAPSPFVVTKLTLTPLGAAIEKAAKPVGEKKPRRPASRSKSDGWVPLFNGKDLTGWYEPEQNKGTWQVVDGALVGRGAGAGGQPAWLATKRRDFTDFQLRLELLRPPVRGQVILRAPAEGGHPSGWDGYRVALINGTTPTGQVFGTGAIGRAAGWPVGNYTAPAEGAPLPTATYTVEIHMSGKTITSFVGGTKVAQYEDPEMLYAAGQIRIYCGFDSDIIFRRIEIKEDRP